jgi:single-strand DNA-binding protein
MNGVNRVTLLGRLGKDVELRYTAGGKPRASFSVATSKSWKDRNTDEWKEKATWHNVVAWDRVAEKAHKRLAKGAMVYIEGEIDNRSYEKDGYKKYISEVVAFVIIPLDAKKDGFDERGDSEPEPAPEDKQQSLGDDDVPF